MPSFRRLRSVPERTFRSRTNLRSAFYVIYLVLPIQVFESDHVEPKGPVLLFSHFFGGSTREWGSVIGLLRDNYSCMAVDAPGFGLSRDIAGYTVHEMCRHFRETIEGLAPRSVILVGHSMTGKVAMVLSRCPPVNLLGVVLVAPSPLNPEPMSEEARAEMTRAQGSLADATSFVKNGATRSLSDHDLEVAVKDVLRTNEAAWVAWPQSGTREDWTMSVKSIDLPSLLVIGESDPAIPLVFQRQHTLPLLKRGRLEVIAGAGHLLPYEAPRELATILSAFVAEVA